MALTPLPTAPQRTDPPEVFVPRADAMVTALVNMVTEINALPFTDLVLTGIVTVASVAGNTADIFGAVGNLVNYTGTNRATGFVAGTAGASKLCRAASACGFTLSATLVCNEQVSGDIDIGAGTVFEVIQETSLQRLVIHGAYSGAFNLTLTGCTTAPTLSCRYTRTGKLVTIVPQAVQITGTSNTTAKTLTGLPFTPVGAFYVIAVMVDNGGTAAHGLVSVSASTTLNLIPDFVGSPWTATGTMSTSIPSFSFEV